MHGLDLRQQRTGILTQPTWRHREHRPAVGDQRGAASRRELRSVAEAVVPWTESMNLPVGSNLPVAAWSVLASPEWLEVHSTDMEENDSEKDCCHRDVCLRFGHDCYRAGSK